MAAEPVPKTIFGAFAGHSAATAIHYGGGRQAEPQQLSAAAHALAEVPYELAYSPIVLAGLVRTIEASLIVAVGLVLYICYGASGYGFAWNTLAVILGIALLAVLAFQVADIYQVQAFRGREKQYMRLASAWSVVLLIAIGISFFAIADDQLSRAWLGSFYFLGMISLITSRRILFLLVRSWTRGGRLIRRTVIVGGGERGSALIAALKTQRILTLK